MLGDTILYLVKYFIVFGYGKNTLKYDVFLFLFVKFLIFCYYQIPMLIDFSYTLSEEKELKWVKRYNMWKIHATRYSITRLGILGSILKIYTKNEICQLLLSIDMLLGSVCTKLQILIVWSGSVTHTYTYTSK